MASQQQQHHKAETTVRYIHMLYEAVAVFRKTTKTTTTTTTTTATVAEVMDERWGLSTTFRGQASL